MDNNQREFIKENAAEMSYKEISKELKIPYSTVKTFCESEGIKAKIQRKLLVQEKKFILNNEGLISNYAIAKKLDISQGTVHNILKNRVNKEKEIKRELEILVYIKGNNDKPALEIAKNIGISRNTVINYATDYGIKLTNKFNIMRYEDKKKLEEKTKYLNLDEISEITDKKKVCIKKYCKKHNIDFTEEQRGLSEEEKKFIVTNKDNMTIKEMAKELELSDTKVRQFLYKNKYRFKRELAKYERKNTKVEGYTDAEKETMHKYSEYMTIEEMAIKINRTYKSVANYYYINRLKYTPKINIGGRKNKYVEIENLIINNINKMTVEEMTRKFNISKNKIYEIGREHNLKFLNRKKETNLKYIRENNNKLTLEELAEDLKLSIETIKKYAKELNMGLKTEDMKKRENKEI